jgi:hypothetical protein
VGSPSTRGYRSDGLMGGGFDALLLLVVGALMAWFMAAPAGIIFGAACWLGAGLLFGGVRFADRLYDRRR